MTKEKIIYQKHGDVWDEGKEERVCSECGNETNIYDCFIYEDEYYCSECCPDDWGGEP